MRGFIAVACIGAVALVLMFFAANRTVDNGPAYTYGDYSDEKYAECIMRKGQPNWRGSSGMSLYDFCKASAAAQTIMEHRRQHPEQY